MRKTIASSTAELGLHERDYLEMRTRRGYSTHKMAAELGVASQCVAVRLERFGARYVPGHWEWPEAEK